MVEAPRFTHIALPVNDTQASIEWYERYTPLRAIDSRRDHDGDVVWLCHPEPTEFPFLLVLISKDDLRGAPQGELGPFGHLGFELPTRDAVDVTAVLGRADGCLAWEPQQCPAPIGYVCALTDPDGNVVEFSFDQELLTRAREVLSANAAPASD